MAAKSKELPLTTISQKTSDDSAVEPGPPKVVQEAPLNDQENVPAEAEPMIEQNPTDDDSERGQSGTDRSPSSGDSNLGVAPPDKFTCITVIFFIQGIGTLYPWNSFITVERFFTDHKFANVSDDTEYKDKFNLSITTGNFVVYLIFLIVALFVKASSSKLLCLVCLLLQLLLFIITTIFAGVDSSQWPEAFFGITMLNVVLFSAASALYQYGMYALATELPGNYSIKSYIAGQGFGGTCVTMLAIISTASLKTLRDSAIMHFTISSVVLLICVITYFRLFKLAYGNVRSILGHEDGQIVQVEYSLNKLCRIVKEAKLQIFNIWMTFFVTLQLYPEVLSNIQSSNITQSSSNFRENYFILIVCFLLFNFFDFAGSVLPSVACMKWKFPRLTIVIVILRLVFIFFIFCNYRPDQRTVPIVLENDVWYAFLVIIFSLSNGYLKTTIIEDGISAVSDPALKSKASSVMLLSLVGGDRLWCSLLTILPHDCQYSTDRFKCERHTGSSHS